MSLCSDLCCSCCCTSMESAYEDDKRETYNSLLRVKTPFPRRSDDEELDVRISSCIYSPIGFLEAIGMIGCGALLWPIPCTVCMIKTKHQGTYIQGSCCLGLRKPNLPCYYEDRLFICTRNENSEGTMEGYDKGYAMPCTCGIPHPLEQEHPGNERTEIRYTSSVTGYDCVTSGVGKIINTLLTMVCCPIACCKKIGS